MTEGLRIVAWRHVLYPDIEALMPDDPMLAEAIAEALAVRLAPQYEVPRSMELARKDEQELEQERMPPRPTSPDIGHC